MVVVPTLTVRNLDSETKDALKALGVEHGRSTEAEARVILASAVRALRRGGPRAGKPDSREVRDARLGWRQSSR
ncbi:FitA-like ribbon-helix-helix domain-containing protein [Salinibacterium sp.]|uniref:FitA-like ribbon-helix-helix domain-containing protein n=1 Tax=Salinibacterium sp. TaxID=1915057 RepID=UPI0037C8D164